MKVTIIGLGLIGGSLAKALRRRAGVGTVYAVDMNEKFINQAVQEGIVKRGAVDWQGYMEFSDIVFVCTPVGATKKWLDFLEWNIKPECIVTDVGSTKQEIVEYAQKKAFHFVGGHPMTGSEKSGYPYARENLFENAYYILTQGNSQKALLELKTVVEKIGALPMELDPEVHDIAVAAVSHVPHVLSSALMNLAANLDQKDGILKLAAGGFRDVTRIAAADPTMWTDISFSNRNKILTVLKQYKTVLQEYEDLVCGSDRELVWKFFHTSKMSRDRLPQKAVLSETRSTECVVDVPDQVGVLSEIVQKISGMQINIKNLYISNSREDYGGTLIIGLEGSHDAQKVRALLKREGYVVVR